MKGVELQKKRKASQKVEGKVRLFGFLPSNVRVHARRGRRGGPEADERQR